MKLFNRVSVQTLALAMGLGSCSLGLAESDVKRERWWPSRWGAEDQIGAANLLTPQKVLEAVQLIRKGEVIDMGRVQETTMPLFSLTPHGRKYTILVPGGQQGPTYGPMGGNALAWNEDYIAGHITQNGTQFDALSHMGTQVANEDGSTEVRYYNGLRHSEIADGHGFKKLGVEQAPPIFTRGILIDVAAIVDEPLDAGDDITMDMVRAALKAQGQSTDDIRTGDAVFVHTGWSRLWKEDNERFNSGVPGLSPEAGDWLVEKEVVLVGTDNWGVESIPNENPELFAPNHQKFLVENGIYIMEHIDFSGLIEKGVYEFAFSFAPIPYAGATGSPARPFAIR